MMRVRGKEFYGDQNRWVSGNKDITWLARSVIIAALKVAAAATDAVKAVCEIAEPAILACYNSAVEPGKKAVDTVAELRSELLKLPVETRTRFYEELALGFLTWHILGIRELTGHPFLTDEDVHEISQQAMFLSALPAEDRAKAVDMLKKAGAYRKELERKAPPGEIKEPSDDQNTDSEA